MWCIHFTGGTRTFTVGPFSEQNEAGAFLEQFGDDIAEVLHHRKAEIIKMMNPYDLTEGGELDEFAE